jgi:hypothetical protein
VDADSTAPQVAGRVQLPLLDDPHAPDPATNNPTTNAVLLAMAGR